jgi:hypothetical protein
MDLDVHNTSIAAACLKNDHDAVYVCCSGKSLLNLVIAAHVIKRNDATPTLCVCSWWLTSSSQQVG